MNKLIEKLQTLKTEHELPNGNTTEYNCGYVKAINDVLNTISLKGDAIQRICEHNFVSSVAYKGARVCSKCGVYK